MDTTTIDRKGAENVSRYRNPAAHKRAMADKLTRQERELAKPRDASLLDALTVIAHDLRGPLANLSLLIEQIETHSRMQSYDRLGRSTRRAQDLILTLDTTLQGFLQRTRETGDPLSFRPALVDLADVVRDAARQNGPVAESCDIVIDCARLRPIVVSGDKRLLIEAVDNLIANAIKHGPKASPVTCAVSVRNRDAVIAITDAGQGPAPDDMKRAFQPFAALLPSFKNRGSTWGTGLWIVRLIAERHGGTVAVVPAGPDRPGTTFEIHVPFELM